MFDNTLSLAAMGGGGDPTVVNRINQDKYSSEYLLKEALYETQVRIRHSKETVKAGAIPMDRHNVEITRTFYATADNPQFSVQTYVVFRVPAGFAGGLIAADEWTALDGLIGSMDFLSLLLSWVS